ncbi:MAG: glycosyltransferase family 39 protein, partial [Chloroflexota bacterium]
MQSVSLETIRLPVTLLFIFALILIWFGQIIYQRVLQSQTGWVAGLIACGFVLFIVAAQLAMRQRVLAVVITAVQALCRYFKIQSWQLLLFCIAPFYVAMTSLAAGDKLIANHALVASVSWLIVIGLLIAAGYKKEEGVVLNRWEIWILAFLFVVALAARGLLTSEFPATFSGDEGSAGLVAVQFFEGTVDNWFVTGWFSFPSFYFAIQSLGIHLWGQTIQAARLISVFVGGMAVIATYWMVRTLFDRVTAVFAAFYLAVSHYHIHFSRIALNNVWDSLFGAIAIYGFWDGWQNGRRTSYLWCGLSLGIGMYFYVSIRVLPVIFLIWSLAAFIWKRKQFFERLPDLILTAVTSVLIALPIGIHFYKFPAQFSAPLNRVTILGPWLEAEVARTGMTQFEIIADQMWLSLLGFTFQPLRLFYEPGVPLLLTGAATLFLIGFVWGIINFDLRYLLLMLPLLATVISNGLSQSPPASQRFILA